MLLVRGLARSFYPKKWTIMSLIFSKIYRSHFISFCSSVGSQCSPLLVRHMLSSTRSCFKDRKTFQKARTLRPGINLSGSSFDNLNSITRSHPLLLLCINWSPSQRDPKAQRSHLLLVSSSLLVSSPLPFEPESLLFSSPSVVTFLLNPALFSFLALIFFSYPLNLDILPSLP